MADQVIINGESTIPEVLKARIQQVPDQIAQIHGDDRMTFGEFGLQVEKIASGLHKLGIKPGEKVALLLPGGNLFPVVMYAVFQMGGVLVAVNPTLKPNEIKYILDNSDTVAVIVSEKIHDIKPLNALRGIIKDLPQVRHVIVDGVASDSEVGLQTLIEAHYDDIAFHKSNPGNLAALIYTSGTTGFPKGAMHTHHTLLYPLMDNPIKMPSPVQIGKIFWRYGPGYFVQLIKAYSNPLKVLMSNPPFTAGGIIGLINYFLMGRIAVHIGKFTPTQVMKTVEKERVNIIGLAPAMAKMLVSNSKLTEFDLSSLIFVALGTSPVPPSLVDEIFEKIGRPILITYGTTELIGTPTLTNPFSDSKQALRETVGKVGVDWEVKVVDENRQPVPVGEIGELVIRGGPRMLGYYKDEELTRQAFDDEGWYYSGDLATIDSQGYVRITGRLKDMIIRAGQNIYPAELENLIMSHSKVHQVSIVGVPDAIAGERVVAFVIPEDGVEISAVEFLNYCREHLAPYKVPSQVIFLKEYPLNATGKVLKHVLREMVLADPN